MCNSTSSSRVQTVLTKESGDARRDLLRSPYQRAAPPPVVLASTSRTQTVHQENMPYQFSLTLPVEHSSPRQCGPHLLFEHPLYCVSSGRCVQTCPQLPNEGLQLGQETGHPADFASNSAHFMMTDHSTRTVPDVCQCLKNFLIFLHGQPYLHFGHLDVDLHLSANPNNTGSERSFLVRQFQAESAPPQQHTHGQPAPLMCRAFEWDDRVIHETVGLRSAVG